MVEMVRKVRSTKIDAGLKVLRGPMTVKLNNLSAMECNVIRPFFQGALDRFYKVGLVSCQPQENNFKLFRAVFYPCLWIKFFQHSIAVLCFTSSIYISLHKVH